MIGREPGEGASKDGIYKALEIGACFPNDSVSGAYSTVSVQKGWSSGPSRAGMASVKSTTKFRDAATYTSAQIATVRFSDDLPTATTTATAFH